MPPAPDPPRQGQPTIGDRQDVRHNACTYLLTFLEGTTWMLP
jgi:hypothetical protein